MRNRSQAIRYWLVVSVALLLGMSRIEGLRGGQSNPSAAALYQQALHEEDASGNLQAAIALYQRVLAAKPDRTLAAQALIRMGGCYQKLGHNESRKIFERVVHEYPDQKDAVSVARAHLNQKTSSTGMISRLVWGGPQVDTYGTVSPDGRYISFTAPAEWRGIPVANVAAGALAVHDLRDGTDRAIERQGDVEESVFSRDSKLIVYTVFNFKANRYQLRLANVEGNPNPRMLFDHLDVDWIAAYDWSPDNRSVVVLLKRKDRTAQIGLVSVPEGSLRVLKSVDWRGTGRIFFSPDGKYVGYDLPGSDNNREHDIFVLNADGTRETAAVAHPSLNFMMGWAADGKWLLFASNRTGSMSLWAAPFADGKVQGPPQLVRPDIGRLESMGMTRSGSFYYGIRSDARLPSSIQVASLESGTGRALAATSIPREQAASDTQPSWSPDGNFLAYLSDRGRLGSSIEQGKERNIVVVIRSSETARLVQQFDLNLNGNVRLIRWTTDGRGLLLTGQDNRGRPGLFRVDAQSGEMAAVGFVDPLKPGEWPDGNWRVSSDGSSFYHPTRQDCNVKCTAAFFRRDLSSGTETELIRADQLGQINLSPDDEFIATAVRDGATNSIAFAVIPTKGGKPREIMRAAAGGKAGETGSNNKGSDFSFLAWAPDSRSVYIRELLDGQPIAAWRAPVDGTTPQKLDWTIDQFSKGIVVAMQPNGRKMAYTTPVSSRADTPSANQIWVLENFLPARSAKNQ